MKTTIVTCLLSRRRRTHPNGQMQYSTIQISEPYSPPALQGRRDSRQFVRNMHVSSFRYIPLRFQDRRDTQKSENWKSGSPLLISCTGGHTNVSTDTAFQQPTICRNCLLFFSLALSPTTKNSREVLALVRSSRHKKSPAFNYYVTGFCTRMAIRVWPWPTESTVVVDSVSNLAQLPLSNYSWDVYTSTGLFSGTALFGMYKYS